jgi:hypothetical protein
MSCRIMPSLLTLSKGIFGLVPCRILPAHNPVLSMGNGRVFALRRMPCSTQKPVQPMNRHAYRGISPLAFGNTPLDPTTMRDNAGDSHATL